LVWVKYRDMPSPNGRSPSSNDRTYRGNISGAVCAIIIVVETRKWLEVAPEPTTRFYVAVNAGYSQRLLTDNRLVNGDCRGCAENRGPVGSRECQCREKKSGLALFFFSSVWQKPNPRARCVRRDPPFCCTTSTHVDHILPPLSCFLLVLACIFQKTFIPPLSVPKKLQPTSISGLFGTARPRQNAVRSLQSGV
jgi:hypothetical protein